MTTERRVRCPFCGEIFAVWVDASIDQQDYIEDCSVCCRPIQFDVQCESGEVLSVNVGRS